MRRFREQRHGFALLWPERIGLRLDVAADELAVQAELDGGFRLGLDVRLLLRGNLSRRDRGGEVHEALPLGALQRVALGLLVQGQRTLLRGGVKLLQAVLWLRCLQPLELLLEAVFENLRAGFVGCGERLDFGRGGLCFLDASV